MPNLPTNPTVLMRDLNQLNQWLTRIVGAYAFADPGQKLAIDAQIRVLFDRDDSHITMVDSRGQSFMKLQMKFSIGHLKSGANHV